MLPPAPRLPVLLLLLLGACEPLTAGRGRPLRAGGDAGADAGAAASAVAAAPPRAMMRAASARARGTNELAGYSDVRDMSSWTTIDA